MYPKKDIFMADRQLQDALALNIMEKEKSNKFLNYIDQVRMNGDMNSIGGKASFNLPGGVTIGAGGEFDRTRPGQVIDSAFLDMPINKDMTLALEANRGRDGLRGIRGSNLYGNPQDYIGANISRKF